DLLCEGRLILGVGTGWNYVEYESLGMEYRNRAKRMEEQVEVMRKLWGNQVVDFDGKYHRIDRAGIYPLPNRQIPVWFGGSAEASVRRAGRIGDGYIFGNLGARVDAANVMLKEEVEANGRNWADFPRDAVVHLQRGEAELAPEVASWKATNPQWISLSTMANRMFQGMNPVNKVDDQITMLERAMEFVKSV
ncbi:MAG: hypothetical protein RJB08_394, partial [Actinomycetota bacterium]